MERGGVAGTAPELGGEFPIQDMSSGEGGLLQVCMEGVGLLFANSKVIISLEVLKYFNKISKKKNIENGAKMKNNFVLASCLNFNSLFRVVGCAVICAFVCKDHSNFPTCSATRSVPSLYCISIFLY